jgi:ribosomal protein S18 acetylase RimI-like enzyme
MSERTEHGDERVQRVPIGAVAGSPYASVREARLEDCTDIARLFHISSDGLAEYVWSRMNMPGLSLMEIGERRYAREGVAFSYRNCLVAEHAGRVVGMVHSYPMAPCEPGAAQEACDPVLAPYSELEDYGSLYISAVALYPEHRGRGIGTRLLEAARERARRLGLPRLSLICVEANRGAMALYERLGFRELGRRPIVPHPMLRYSGGDALLLACELDRMFS